MEKVDHFLMKMQLPGKIYVVCALMEPQRCLSPKVDFEHLCKRRHPKFCLLIASFTGKLIASKTLPCGLQGVLKATIKIVNFVRSSALHTRLFRKLCEDMGSQHMNLLYYTKVRWLSKGNVFSRVFELRDELKIFFNVTKTELAVHFSDSKFIACLAYLVDIFDSLDTLNVKMQGKEKNIIHFVDLINGFIEKLSK